MMNGHIPVMPKETLELLSPERGGIFVDGTLGGGGHSELILKRMPPGSRLYGIDRDPLAIEKAAARLKGFEGFTPIRGNFFDMKTLLEEMGVFGADGILLDLGVSSFQLDMPERGFSYHNEAPLDMRMDTEQGFSAADVVNGYPAEKLVRIIRDYGEERYAKRIAQRIAEERAKNPIRTTAELAEIIKRAVPAANRWEGQHPARRTFQAIRIEVNGELEELGRAIRSAHDLLKPSGVLAVISFHSLEDRIVKQAFKEFENPCVCDPKAPICTCGKRRTADIITKKPIIPDETELKNNPRARSAKLRAIRKNNAE